jgi:hypothetical protein
LYHALSKTVLLGQRQLHHLRDDQVIQHGRF